MLSKCTAPFYYDNCFFCNPPPDRVIARKKEFACVLASGPLTEGHFLLTTRKHISGLLDLHLEQIERLIKIKRALRKMMEELYGACLFIEHGRHGHQHEKELHCSHAHLHILPLAVDIKEDFRKKGCDELFADYDQSLRLAGEYTHFEDAMGKPHFFKIDEPLERRWIRKVLLDKLGAASEWANWEQHPRTELIKATYESLEHYVYKSLELEKH